jgi:hypothetical protein
MKKQSKKKLENSCIILDNKSYDLLCDGSVTNKFHAFNAIKKALANNGLSCKIDGDNIHLVGIDDISRANDVINSKEKPNRFEIGNYSTELSEVNNEIEIDNKDLLSVPSMAMTKSVATALVNRLKVLVKDATKMTMPELITCANDMFIRKVIPSKDVYYVKLGDKLQIIDHYTYSLRVMRYMDKVMGGNGNVTIKDSEFSDEDYKKHNVNKNTEIGVNVRLISSVHRKARIEAIKGYKDIGFSPQESIEMVETQEGELGVQGYGVYPRSKKPPQSWSVYQAAVKLGIKNTIKIAYPQPSGDDYSEMAGGFISQLSSKQWGEIIEGHSHELFVPNAQIEDLNRTVGLITAQESV